MHLSIFIADTNNLILTTKKPKLTLCDIVRCPPYAECIIDALTKAPLCICTQRCTLRFDMVCASNMKHYPNTCFMQLESCSSDRKLVVLKKGLCPFKKKYRRLTWERSMGWKLLKF